LNKRLWQESLKITPDYGAFVVVVEVTLHPGGLESNPQGEGKQALHLQGRKEEHLVLQTKKLSCNTWQQLRKEGLESRDTQK